MATNYFPVPTHLISICKTNVFICSLGHAYETICKYENGCQKVARIAFSIGEAWNPVCCHGNKLLSSYFGAHI